MNNNTMNKEQIEQLALEAYPIDICQNIIGKYDANAHDRNIFLRGFEKASELLYTKEDLYSLVQNLKDYTSESLNILGHDDREPKEFVDIFLQSLKQ